MGRMRRGDRDRRAVPEMTADPPYPITMSSAPGETLYSIAQALRARLPRHRALERYRPRLPDPSGRPAAAQSPPGGACRRGGGSPAPRAPACAARIAHDPAHRPPRWRWPVEVGTVVGTVRQPSGGARASNRRRAQPADTRRCRRQGRVHRQRTARLRAARDHQSRARLAHGLWSQRVRAGEGGRRCARRPADRRDGARARTSRRCFTSRSASKASLWTR